ncbi:MAG: DEAD/DEAH box helicase [Nitrososphaerota archaeon]
MIDTGELLKKLGYEYYELWEEKVVPNRVALTFSDILPELERKNLEIASYKLFEHQLKSYQALLNGRNLILKSGTGSGKTESWFLYAAKKKCKTLVLYPTLALSNDQIVRLRNYGEAVGLKIMIIDAPSKSRIVAEKGYKNAKREIADADIILTNPAFLLSDIKKLGTNKPPFLREFLYNLSFLVIDDFDFYSPRSIAILLGMLRIIGLTVTRNPQIAILTAMLENPIEIGNALKSINGREYEIIEGKAYHPENKIYVILGKNLKKIWEDICKERDKIEKLGVGKDIEESLNDYDVFKKNFYKVLEIARIAGVRIEEESSPSYLDILSSYAEDSGLTIVFTRSISKSEEIARLLSDRLGNGKVYAHHHLIDKNTREKIEEMARNGEIKILVSPRTLSQGIDIGQVIRTVHIGLPETLREFLQKEGRKGRREAISRTESIIIPQYSWDYNLLRRGTMALIKWLSLSREKIILNQNNKYITLFTGLFKMSRPSLFTELTEDELKLLDSLRLRKDLQLTQAGKRAWLRMNFYEFAPPLGIKRLKKVNEHYDQLEDISHVDLVEKFQIGCIDYTSDGIVTRHVRSRESSRAVTAVVIEDLSEPTLMKYEELSYPLEEYYAVKRRWSETPSIKSDYYSGRLHSDVQCVVKAPDGFDKYVKIPNHVQWRVRSKHYRYYVIGENTILSHEARSIIVPALTNGVYYDYTYGMLFEMDPSDDPNLLRLGLAFIELVMRRILSIPFDTIEYDVTVVGDRKFVGIHETESAGLLEILEWLDFKKKLEEYQPDELDEFLLEEINETAFSSWISRGMDWNVAKHYSIKIIDQILLRKTLKLSLGQREIVIPLPSKSHKRVVLTANKYVIDPHGVVTLYCIGIYDGERFYVPVGFKTPEGIDEAYLEVSAILSKRIDENFTIYTYDLSLLKTMFSSLGLKSLEVKLLGIELIKRLVDVKKKFLEKLGKNLPLNEAENLVGLKRDSSPIDIAAEAARISLDISNPNWRKIVLDRLAPIIEKVTVDELKNTYLLSFILESEFT